MTGLWGKRAERSFTSRRAEDSGVSLVETIVAMMIFAIILTVITASIVTMLKQQRKQTSQTDDLNAARNVIEMLDHQVRYANALTTPGTGTDGSTYVEFRSGYDDLQQTCTQWRYVPTSGAMQYRTWLPPLTGSGSVTAGSWSTAGTGFTVVGTTPIFSIAPPTTTSSGTQTAQTNADTHYQLTVTFNVSSGSPSVTSQSQVTITAINSTRSPISPTPPSVCTEIGRP
jgi:prepilin-type N-terminal cleavage/methylation domain-containing protein